MMSEHRTLPRLPTVGCPESYYAKLAHDADRNADAHAHEAAKVGQYITLALDEHLNWDDKLKYFRHAIKRHCQPPQYADDNVVAFYAALADLVRQHAGQEALRIASREDDLYAARLSMGQSRDDIENEAEDFFLKLLGTDGACPHWFNDIDYQQLKLIRDQWI